MVFGTHFWGGFVGQITNNDTPKSRPDLMDDRSMVRSRSFKSLGGWGWFLGPISGVGLWGKSPIMTPQNPDQIWRMIGRWFGLDRSKVWEDGVGMWDPFLGWACGANHQ